MGGACGKVKDDPSTEYSRSMFKFSKIIGKGGFSRVWKVCDKQTKNVYAMKVMDKAKIIAKKSVSSVMNERIILSHLLQRECKFIVNMKCAFQDRQNLYLLLDYVDGGDLRYYISRKYSFNEEEVSKSIPYAEFMARCLIQGLNHIHAFNIIHRDIKPENIILDKRGYAKITDLGIARYWKTENSNETSGTPGYMAPQVLMCQNHSFCTDFYAMGVVLYEMLVGERPYTGKDRKTTKEQMLSRQATLPKFCESRISVEGANFVNRLLSRTAKKRLGYNGITELFRHPWLQMSAQDKQLFNEQQLASPITPIQVTLNEQVLKHTVPDENVRESILLLKKAQIQQVFQEYDFAPVVAEDREQSKQAENNKNEPPLTSISTLSSTFFGKIINI